MTEFIIMHTAVVCGATGQDTMYKVDERFTDQPNNEKVSCQPSFVCDR